MAFDLSTTDLQPATYKSGALYTKEEAEKAEGGTAITTKASYYIQTQFFIKVNGDTPVNYKNVGVTSYNVKDYALLQAVGSSTQGSTVKAAAGNALRMAVAYAAQNDGTKTSINMVTGNAGSKGSDDAAISTIGKNVYGFTNQTAYSTARGGANTAATVTDNKNGMTADAFANAYYAAVMGTTATGITTSYDLTSTFNTSTNLETAFFTDNEGKSAAVTTGDYKVYAVCLTFWLEGYDADCFDRVLGQDMDISLSLTTLESLKSK